PSTLNIGEGDSAIINCSYTGSASSYFPWYKQEPGKRSHLLIDTLENVDRKQKQRLTVLLDKKAKQFSLHITVTHPGDSAIYFCAAAHNGSQAPVAFSQTCYGGLSPSHILCHVVKHLLYCLFVMEANIQIFMA
ncbi:T cell receptor alpha variable 13-1, partial [Lemmus lemmus]